MIDIIGAGLSGSAAAYFLANKGFKVNIYEKESEIASGASGNDYGIVYPRIELSYSPAMFFYHNAFDFTVNFLDQIAGKNVGWSKCGMVFVANEQERAIKLIKLLEAKKIPYKAEKHLEDFLPYPALFIKDGGYLSPKNLCKFLLNHPNINLNTGIKVEALDQKNISIIANSFAANSLLKEMIFIEKVKGQISKIDAKILPEMNIKNIICKNCYLIPKINDHYYFGATFERHIALAEVTEKAHIDNLVNLSKTLNNPTLELISPQLLEGRSAFRSYTKDKIPIIDKISDNLYLSICHGSRGILSALYGGFLLSNLITDNLSENDKTSLSAVSTKRKNLFLP